MRLLRSPFSMLAATVAALLAAGTGSGRAAEDPTRPRGPHRADPIAAAATVRIDPATGNPRLVRVTGDRPVPDGAAVSVRALALLEEHAAAFGLDDPKRQLLPVGTRRDPLGGERATFRQVYHGVPVFGAVLRVHFDADGAVTTINGTTVSDIDVDPIPRVDSHVAEAAAVRLIAKRTGRPPERLEARPGALMVYRSGLVRGVRGTNHLAWEIEVVSPPDLHEILYLDAHDGRLLDRRSEIHRLDRVVHRHRVPQPIWSEGDPLPFAGSGGVDTDAEINELIRATGDTFELFANLTGGGYLSYDGVDGTMNSIYDSDSIDCPNAVESGGVTAFCVDMVSDDVVAHEWAHAYTGWTHGLIYQWQPGALNEAYSDIFGELVDQLNQRGTDSPAGVRPAVDCSAAGGSPAPTLDVESPPAVTGTYPVGGAVFNPAPPWSVTAGVELADDGTGATTDACQPLVGLTTGSIALIDRGICLFRDKVANAEAAGAVGVIIVNNQGDDVLEMGGDTDRLGIPAVFLGQSDGARLKAALGDGVLATLDLDGSTVDSVRWLIGEDTRALGAIRDMWSPECFGDPGRVGSINYACSGDDDNGGVHTNSGVPNHAFTLLVDGGSYNGRQIQGIGATKAARIYWRAMSVYQTPVTNFSAHADLLETSCQDLIGAQLYDLATGAPVAETLSPADCGQVAAALEAVEMRANPDQCGFEPLLQPDAPPIDSNLVLLDERFDSDPSGSWQLANRGIFPEYDSRDWTWTGDTPPGGDGGAFFAIDSVLIGDCRPGSDDQSGVMELTSPTVAIPLGSTSPILSFDHWIATEAGWDGGNVKISVNGGGFVQLPSWAFLHNPYNARINSANTNPLAGEQAFTGAEPGTVAGSWGQSQVDISAFASAGDRIAIRFDFGVDGCNGVEGWYVDNVRITATAFGPRLPGGRRTP